MYSLQTHALGWSRTLPVLRNVWNSREIVLSDGSPESGKGNSFLKASRMRMNQRIVMYSVSVNTRSSIEYLIVLFQRSNTHFHQHTRCTHCRNCLDLFVDVFSTRLHPWLRPLFSNRRMLLETPSVTAFGIRLASDTNDIYDDYIWYRLNLVSDQWVMPTTLNFATFGLGSRNDVGGRKGSPWSWFVGWCRWHPM